RPVQSFAACDIDDIRVRRRHRNRSNRLCWLVLKNRIPSAPIVIALPDAPIDRAHVEHIRLARYSGYRPGTPASNRTDHAPTHAHMLGKLLAANGLKNCAAKRR